MTSQELLLSWDKTRSLFGRRSICFFCLHRICAAGAEGISMTMLTRQGAVPGKSTFWRWRHAGLITHTIGRSETNRRTVTYHATEKAYQLLRVTAPQTTEN